MKIAWELLSFALLPGVLTAQADDSKGNFFYDQQGALVRQEIDTTGDGRPDIWIFYANGRIERIEEDRTYQGRPTVWTHYVDGVRRWQALDTNGSGVVDARQYFDPDGKVVRVERDTDRDGRFDLWGFYESGVIVRAEQDLNADGTPDKFLFYREGASPGPRSRRSATGASTSGRSTTSAVGC